MVNEQNLFLVNDEDGDGEINFFVDVCHKLPEKINNKAAGMQIRDTNFTN